MPEKEKKKKKKHVSPKNPEELLTCSSYLARELVPQYLRLGVLNQTDAVALYVFAGIVEFGREGKSFYESRGAIARALGLPKKSVKTYLDRLMADGIIVRTGEADAPLEECPWSAPGLTPPSTSPPVSSVLNTTLENEIVAGGNNVYPDVVTPSNPGDTPSNPGDTPCGPHIRESEEEKSKVINHKGKECLKTPPSVSRSSSFKKRSKTETRQFLGSFPWGDHQLDSPDGLASFWSDFTGKWRSPCEAKAETDNVSAAEIDPMEIRRAFMTLKQMRIYKTPETVRLWLEWYVKAGGLNKSEYITQFSKSWDDYVHIAARAFVEQMNKETISWGKKLDARLRRDAGKTMPVIANHRELGEEERQKVRESFCASLPDSDDIKDAVFAVPIDADLEDDNEYVRWLDSLAKAVPVLGPFTVIDDSGQHLDFVRLAREDYRGDIEGFANMTGAFVVAEAEYFVKFSVKYGDSHPKLYPFSWLHYARFFNLAPGIDEAERSLREADGSAPL